MPKVVAMMVVRNEAHRYLSQCLESLQKYVDEIFVLDEGDSIYFMGSIPHKTTNISSEDLIFISAITPPHF